MEDSRDEGRHSFSFFLFLLQCCQIDWLRPILYIRTWLIVLRLAVPYCWEMFSRPVCCESRPAGNVDLLKGMLKAMLMFQVKDALLYIKHRGLLIVNVLELSPNQGLWATYFVSQMLLDVLPQSLPMRWCHLDLSGHSLLSHRPVMGHSTNLGTLSQLFYHL